MTDREYVKLNSSIQTASNSSQLKERADGTIPAEIELRLPDNLYTPNSGGKKVDTVSMLTTKFRVSLSETPIIQLPMDRELSVAHNTPISSCKIDVYPHVLTNEGIIRPEEKTDTAFPSYKLHELTIQYRVRKADDTIVTYPDVDYCVLNDEFMIQNTPFFELVKSSGILEPFYHLLNLCIPKSQEIDEYNLNTSSSILLKSFDLLEQTLEDSIQNAITYATTQSTLVIEVELVDVNYPNIETLVPRPLTDKSVWDNVHNLAVYYYTYSIKQNLKESELDFAVKPHIAITEDKFRLNYDTAPFRNKIPIMWNSSYIDTYDEPMAMTLDTLRNECWGQPVPKRQYQYNVSTTGDDQTNLQYSLNLMNPLNPRVFNIIGNKATRDTLSFLPWLEIDFTKQLHDIEKQFYSEQNSVRETLSGNQTTTTSLQTEHYIVHAVGEVNSENSVYSLGYAAAQGQAFLTPETSIMQNVLQNNNEFCYVYCFDFDETDPSFDGQNYLSVTPANRSNQYFIVKIANRTGGGGASHKTPNWTVDVLNPNESVEFTSTTSTRPFIIPEHEVDRCTYITQRILPTGIDVTTAESASSKETEETSVDAGEDYQNLPWWYNWSTGKFELGTSEIDGSWRNQHLNTRPQWTDEDAVDDLRVLRLRHYPKFQPDQQYVYATNGTTKSVAIKWILYTEGQTIPDPAPAFSNAFLYTLYIWGYNPYEYGENLQEVITTEYTDVVKNTKTIKEINLYQVKTVHYPYLANMSNDERIFILNGASANLTLGQTEVVQVPTNTLYQITEKKTPQEISGLIKYFSGSGNYFYTTATPTEGETFILYDEVQDPSNKDRLYQPVTIRNYRAMGIKREINGVMYRCFVVSYYINQQTSAKRIATTQQFESIEFESGETQTGWRNPVISYANVDTLDTEEGVPTTTIEESNDPEYGKHIGETETRTIPVSKELQKYYSFRVTVVTQRRSESLQLCLLKVNTMEYKWTNLQKKSWSGEAFIPGTDWLPLYTATIRDAEPGEDLITEYYPIESNTNIDEEPPVNYKHLPTIVRATIKEDSQTGVAQAYLNSQNYIIETSVNAIGLNYKGNVKLGYEWGNLPTVTMSPIQSFVLVLNGMQVSQEIHPVNIAQAEGSSLTSTIPIIENYYSFATSLRDLHDELVVTKDTFDDAARYSLATTSGQERSIKLSVKYITKDGKIHQLYIPREGVYTLQLTFGLNYYL